MMQVSRSWSLGLVLGAVFLTSGGLVGCAESEETGEGEGEGEGSEGEGEGEGSEGEGEGEGEGSEGEGEGEGEGSGDPDPALLLISEYVEGLGEDKALEFYNGSGGDLDLELAACELATVVNGGPNRYVLPLQGVVPAHGTFVLCRGRSTAELLTYCDDTTGHLAMTFNGNDSIELSCGGVILDVFGRVGEEPEDGWWGDGLWTSKDQSLRRRCGITRGDTDGSDEFVPLDQWYTFLTGVYAGLGRHDSDCSTGLGSPPGHACGCDADCRSPSAGHLAVCVVGLCMELAADFCSTDGSTLECPAGHRCWDESGSGMPVCWPDCASFDCDGQCDGEGSCIPVEGSDCDPACGSICTPWFAE